MPENKAIMTSACTSMDMDSEDIPQLEVDMLSYRKVGPDDKVFKDECMYCFKTPIYPGGLYVCMQTFAGFCDVHVLGYSSISGQRIFLHRKQTKVMRESDEPKDKVTKLAIGIEGGFETCPNFEIIDEHSLVIVPEMKTIQLGTLFKMSNELYDACKKIIAADGVQRAERLEASVSAWDGEARITTRHANLQQLDNGVKVPASSWRCQADGCDLTENLWLNLTDGAIKCGRSQYLSEGKMSKGNNHMREHFDATGYALVVKLGTITSKDADVYSYDEDESVIDPKLKEHLMHFGIDMDKVEKTEKSTFEMELDLNQKWEWRACQEDGQNLDLAYGPGFTGLVNLGSSCYINASVQLLMMIPTFKKVFGTECDKIFRKFSPLDSHNSFDCQTAKLFSSMLSGDFAVKDSQFNGIKPAQFKKLVGKDHPEFSTARQQDADEYIRHLLSKIDDSTVLDSKPVDALRFKLEHRLQDNASKKVRYEESEEYILSLNVPSKTMQMMQTQEEPAEADGPVRPLVLFDECLLSTFGDQLISGFRSPITGAIEGAIQRDRISTFPDFLIITLKKFGVASDWTVKKLNVDVGMPYIINLEAYRAKGFQPNEERLSDAETTDEISFPNIDHDVVKQLRSMGFSPEASRRAVYITGNTGIQAATLWLTDHASDSDVNEEHPDLLSNKKQSRPESDTTKLVNLGFSEHQARYALRSLKGIDEAAEWLLLNGHTVPPEVLTLKPTFHQGTSVYELIGFISHMGTTPHSGHYVAHLKKDGVWYLYNDEKVAVSRNPPTKLGYIYLYKRR